MAENSVAAATVTAADADVGAALTFTIAGGDDASRFAIDANTGALSFLSAPDFENPADTNHDNAYEVVVRVSDGHGGVDEQAITVNVTDVAPSFVGDDNPNTLDGTAENDTISGLGGNDTLRGLDGNDTIYGGAGNDAVNGGAGNDIMYGGTGDDIYAVDSAGDVVIENANEGWDTVAARVNYTLGANIEQLNVKGDATAGTGNELDNVIYGLPSGNSLTLDGAGGNDTIYGSNQSDMIIGGLGNDHLYGFGGNDTFVYDAVGLGVDTIADFTAGDRIDVHSLFTDFAAVQAAAVQVGADTHIVVNAGNEIVLANFAIGNLHASDFLF